MTDHRPNRLLLLGWDAAEWHLVQPLLDAGRLPHLASLVDTGALAHIKTLSPMISAPLWTTVATGRRPEQHGICGNHERDGETLRPISASARRGRALWDIAAAAGRPSVVVNWPASHPATETAGLALVFDKAAVPSRLVDDVRELRVQPAELSRDDLRPFVPDVDRLSARTEAPLAALGRYLARSASTHAVATFLLETEPWEFAAVHYGALGRICRAFLDYTAPRLPQISEEHFARYRGVIDQALILQDQMLGGLLALAGERCAVLLGSTHGWCTGPQRPQLQPGEHAANIARERAQGWAVLRTPGGRRDELIHGGSILDLAPTALWLLGLPVPRDWTGRVWIQALHAPPTPAHVDSHESGPLAPPEFSPQHSDAALSQAFAYGNYLLHAGRIVEAIPVLEEVQLARTEDIRPRLQLIKAYIAGRRFPAAKVLIESSIALIQAVPTGPSVRRAKYPPEFDFMRGVIAENERRLDDARTFFEAALQAGAQTADMHTHLGQVHFACRRYREAQSAFRRGLEIDPDSHAAHYGLARVYYRQREFARAADHALQASYRQTEPPEYHLLLGLALARTGPVEQAIVALNHALARQPDLRLARRILRKMQGSPESD